MSESVVASTEDTEAVKQAKAALLLANTAKSDTDDFRNYDTNGSTIDNRVTEHYRDMRTHQTVAFYQQMELKYQFGNASFRQRMTIEEAFCELEEYVDASDPDLDLPNKLHLLQTAEGIRRDGNPDWMQLTGLLHDMGKIMFLWGDGTIGQDGRAAHGKQWALGGDTWVVGCRLPETCILPQFNRLNPDMEDDRYNTKYGMYEPHCGLDALQFCWGHDEYMYRMLVANETTLPREALDMIRYHSAYPLHDQNAYSHLLTDSDLERLEYVRLFNKYDLYTKDGDNDIRDKLDELWPYYRGLLDKYGLGGRLKW